MPIVHNAESFPNLFHACRIHDDMGSSSFHYLDIIHTVSGHGRGQSTGLSFLYLSEVITLAPWNCWLPEDAECVRCRSPEPRILNDITVAEWLVVHPDGQAHLAYRLTRPKNKHFWMS